MLDAMGLSSGTQTFVSFLSGPTQILVSRTARMPRQSPWNDRGAYSWQGRSRKRPRSAQQTSTDESGYWWLSSSEWRVNDGGTSTAAVIARRILSQSCSTLSLQKREEKKCDPTRIIRFLQRWSKPNRAGASGHRSDSSREGFRRWKVTSAPGIAVLEFGEGDSRRA